MRHPHAHRKQTQQYRTDSQRTGHIGRVRLGSFSISCAGFATDFGGLARLERVWRYLRAKHCTRYTSDRGRHVFDGVNNSLGHLVGARKTQGRGLPMLIFSLMVVKNDWLEKCCATADKMRVMPPPGQLQIAWPIQMFARKASPLSLDHHAQ